MHISGKVGGRMLRGLGGVVWLFRGFRDVGGVERVVECGLV